MKVIHNYTLTLNFVKEKIINHFYNILVYKVKKIMMTKKIKSKKSLHILEDDASGRQVGDIEQAIV